MNHNQKSDSGRSLTDALQDAVQSGDYSRLRQTVNTTFQSVVSKTIECVQSARGDAAYLFDWDTKPKSPPSGWGPCAWNPGHVWEPEDTPQPPKPPEPPPRAEHPGAARPKAGRSPEGHYGTERSRDARTRQRSTARAQNPLRPSAAVEKSIPAPPYLKRTAGEMAIGVLLIITGLLFLLPACASALFFLLGLLLEGVQVLSITLSVVMLAIAIPAGVLTRRGFLKFGRARRFRKYWEQLQKKGYCEISVLAGVLEKKERFVLKDITRMLSAGLFPEGHLDDAKTCLIIGDDMYRQYRAAHENSRKQMEAPTSENAVIAAGLEAVRQIRAANAALPGQLISEKLSRLEDVTTGIFAYVEQRPAKLAEIRRFIDYYLPTTVKLVKSYQEFESQPETASTAAAKQEILATLDTISTAFETLLDGLYQDDTIDISTDISVLKTILAQEGLTENDFGKKRNNRHE